MGELVGCHIETLHNAGAKRSRSAMGKPAIRMAFYSALAILHGREGDVWKMVTKNFL